MDVKCTGCGKKFYRSLGRINEGIKRNWKPYCSLKCLGQSMNRQRVFECCNPKCKKLVRRLPNEFKRSKYVYCSRSCSAIVNNSKSPKRQKKIRICPTCSGKFTGFNKYCSSVCIEKRLINKKTLIRLIRGFYDKHQRIPLKREFKHYRAARGRFGTWNKTIEAAGFKPNPVMFAKKWIAKDGHKCDSLAEKIIDDWLYREKFLIK